jgi:hypothetical protein
MAVAGLGPGGKSLSHFLRRRSSRILTPSVSHLRGVGKDLARRIHTMLRFRRKVSILLAK